MNNAVSQICSTPPDLSTGEMSALYRGILLVRRAEERLSALFADGAIPGFIHLSIGQEAVPVGVIAHMNQEDTIASTHRGHGHAIAKGLPLDGFFSELLGREEGLCKGRGGSMHVADLSIGMLGANGIVAAGASIALGSALAHKTLKRSAIAAAFFGDGALAEGLLHESLNMARLLALPILFVCENNGWSEFSPTDRQVAFTLERLSAAYTIPYRRVDGDDVAAVSAVSRSVVADVRSGKGPAVLECLTHRVRGHYEGDAQKYRNSAEIHALNEYDPVRIAAERLLAMGVRQSFLDQTAEKIDEAISAAVTTARKGQNPCFDSARRDVYSAGTSG